MTFGGSGYGTTGYAQSEPFRIMLPVPEGDAPSSIVRISGLVGRALVEHFGSDLERLRTIDRRLFEELVAEIFSGFGYEVELTKRTRDGGKDVVAVRRSEANVRYLIECKRPDPGGVIGVRPVRELYGVKTMENATKAILATTVYFSPDAKLLFEEHEWELEGRDFDGVTAWIAQYMSAPR